MPFEITKAVVVATTITTSPQVEERQGIVIEQPQVKNEIVYHVPIYRPLSLIHI